VTHAGYTRNALGQVTEAQSPAVTYTMSYDAAHRLATVRDSRGGIGLTYRWSPGGQLNNFEDSQGHRTDYAYDPVGRLTGLWAPNGDLVSFLYDAGGRLIQKWFPNGVATQYTWNPDNTLAQVLNLSGDTTLVSQHDYTYDGVGNRATYTEQGALTLAPSRYVYDALNRLVEVRGNTSGALLESYTYDVLGNRTSKTDSTGATLAYGYDAANQLLEVRQGAATGLLLGGLVYDAAGNLTKKCEDGALTITATDCTGDTVTALTYDALNRLTQAAKSGQATQRYVYDDQGRRIGKTVGSTATNSLYNGADIVSQYETTWTRPTALVTHGPQTDDPLIRTTSTTAQYYHQDGLGSVVALTNPDGSTAAMARYDAWGSTVVRLLAIPLYGYTGREPDETGLIYYRARYYDPTLGRFTQRDSIGFAGGDINLYTYVRNNPISLVDPDGQLAFFWHFGITFAAGLKSGMGIGQSLKYGWYAAAPDLRPSAWSSTQEAQVGHALSGTPAPGTARLDPQQALQATEAFVSQNLRSSDIVKQGEAFHATQDVPQHQGERWPPSDTWFGDVAKGIAHIVRDIFPSPSVVGEAYDRTLQGFETIQSGAGSRTISPDLTTPVGGANTSQPSLNNLQDIGSATSVGPYTGSQSWGFNPRGIK